MKGFLLGIIVTIALITVAVFLYFSRGLAPVATAAPPMPFETRLAKMALNARIEKEMPQAVPIQPDDANLIEGAHLYTEHCAVCHGLPGQEKTATAQGMYPEPPELFLEKGVTKGVTDDPPGENYWKAANGIRLTGMPAFKNSLSDKQLWQVSLLLTNADKISQAVKDALQPQTATPR